MIIAITREVSRRFAECEITHIERTPINVETARAQHREYTRLLASLGCKVIELPEEAHLPDSVFVEDTAVILPELAVITRPGADTRKPETESVARALSPFRRLAHITAPATLDGGDVLVVGKQIYVGMSTRSNAEGIHQLREVLGGYGYTVTGVELDDCLHLKSAVTRVNDSTLLINKDWVDKSRFKNFDLIEIDPSEPYSANCLPVRDAIVFPAAFPKTRAKLEERGFNAVTVNVDELAKAEGAVTCCSLIVAD
jgi:dimethylargininase